MLSQKSTEPGQSATMLSVITDGKDGNEYKLKSGAYFLNFKERRLRISTASLQIFNLEEIHLDQETIKGTERASPIYSLFHR